MPNFNFLFHIEAPTEIKPEVRTRATARDPYACLRGKDYIAARALNQPVKKVQASVHPAGTDTRNNQARF